jgi:DNA-binding NarL/FixJ family response regulator
MCPARILVADDHDCVRQGLRSIIQQRAEWELIAEAVDGNDAVAKARKLKPDIIILDISMPVLNGLEATKQILDLVPKAKVLIFTMLDSEQAIEKAVKAGARGYVLKADAGRDVVRAVESLTNGQTFFTQKATKIILGEFAGKGPRPPERDRRKLTGKEREILRWLVEGKISREVAAILKLSARDVEVHRINLMRKFGCHCLSELVRYAVRNELVIP